jgi:hypothetical protein
MQTPEQNVKSIQVISVALAMGLLVLGIVFILVILSRGQGMVRINGPAFPDPANITTVLLFLSGVLLVSAAWIPPLISRSITGQLLRDQSMPAMDRPAWEEPADLLARVPPPVTQRLVGGYATQALVRGALLESAGMLSAMAFLLEAHWISLTLWGAAILGILLAFPTSTRLQRWLETQAQRLGHAV